MTAEEIVFESYQQRFGNIDEVAAPNILLEERFVGLLQAALASGVPLTRAAVEAILPEADYEELGV